MSYLNPVTQQTATNMDEKDTGTVDHSVLGSGTSPGSTGSNPGSGHAATGSPLPLNPTVEDGMIQH